MNSSPLSDYYDVIVVGAGAAGLYAALCVESNLNVALVTKDKIDRSASDWAQGGIAAAISSDDSPRLHLEDTLKAGAGLCNEEAVQFLATHAADCIQSLVSLGVAFDRNGPELALTLEAAHSRRRVLHAADTTGRAIVSTLIHHVIQRSNISIFDNTFVLDAWLSDDRTACQGVSLLYESDIRWVAARAVVLATGGGGQVFSQTTNPKVSTGDGVAIAWRAGAVLRDLEFIQFHPTALTKAGAPRFLISEAVRGEGAHLINSQGHRFAFDYHPKGELAPRDVVSRAIFDYLKTHGSVSNDELDHVWLDLSVIDSATIRHRFPNIIQVCKQWGVDLFTEPIPVAPAAHYWMGGIAVDLTSQSSILGLYAVGETANTGVHGANRLASNSLLECLVFGANLKSIRLLPPQSITHPSSLEQLPNKERVSEVMRSLTKQFDVIQTIRFSLPHLLWKSAGISRKEADLSKAIIQVQSWHSQLSELPVSQFIHTLHPTQKIWIESQQFVDCIKFWEETRNLVQVAQLILQSAIFRQESRGGHFRSDFPTANPSWATHTLSQNHRCWISGESNT